MPRKIYPVEVDAFHIRVEAKINRLLKAVGWLLGFNIFAAAIYIDHTWGSNWQLGWAGTIALGVGAIYIWLGFQRPLTKLEEDYPLFAEDYD